jgi:hypothetical protein
MSFSNRDFNEIILKKSIDSSNYCSGDDLIFSSYSDLISNPTYNDIDSENKRDNSTLGKKKKKKIKNDSFQFEKDSKLSWSISCDQ